ncbi:MAG: TIGR00269 family protein [Desulfurococcaceae archaeon]
MVNCTMCGKPAMYINKVSGIAYCRQHFIDYFERKVRKTIRKYNMFGKKEHILVATSGGKDSMSLLHILWKLSKKNPSWEITAVLVDEGIKGYRERTIKNLVKYANERGIKFIIASFRDYIGMSLDDIVDKGRGRNLPYQPCSYCGVFRRNVINTVAKEIDATVIATAHNLDDVVQTYLMNLINNSLDRIMRLTPVRKEGSFIKRVKPFYEVLEKESALYALSNNLIEPEYVQCPYAKYNIRFLIRRLVNELEDKYPGSKYGLLKSLLQIINQCNMCVGSKSEKYETCAICGEPASNIICKSCVFKYQLNLLSPELSAKIKDIIEKSLQI